MRAGDTKGLSLLLHDYGGDMSKITWLTIGVAIGVLFSAVCFSGLAENKTLDPAKLDPAMYKVVLENKQLRAIDYHIGPGQTEPMHSHPCGVFVYFFTDADMASTLADGNKSEGHSRAGDVVWRSPVTHFGKNIGNKEAHMLLVEPKEGCNDSATQ
jgi:beta-alanine degradation protein BauB